MYIARLNRVIFVLGMISDKCLKVDDTNET